MVESYVYHPTLYQNQTIAMPWGCNLLLTLTWYAIVLAYRLADASSDASLPWQLGPQGIMAYTRVRLIREQGLIDDQEDAVRQIQFAYESEISTFDTENVAPCKTRPS
ncbi:hypothetical protein BC835DRAFT_280487 [Cytidiella melzeri]|nr:hypothetical protein BC835DRAFT_280487 [Cytidiella melzeri]